MCNVNINIALKVMIRNRDFGSKTSISQRSKEALKNHPNIYIIVVLLQAANVGGTYELEQNLAYALSLFFRFVYMRSLTVDAVAVAAVIVVVIVVDDVVAIV